MTKTDIEWADYTWNPVTGCSLVSKGCMNCYAMREAHRWSGQKGSKYEGTTHRLKTKDGEYIKRGVRWNGKIRLHNDLLREPFNWGGEQKVFVNSMSDLFHPKVPNDFINDVFATMRDTPQHTYQILTKRPKAMMRFCKEFYSEPLRNVWLGTSVESAKVANRVNYLRDTPAAVRFISLEPLIGSVRGADVVQGLDWVIVGGESGAGARAMNPLWVGQIHGECAIYGVPFFFKQWGEYGADGVKRPKKENGRELNGETYDEMPFCYEGLI